MTYMTETVTKNTTSEISTKFNDYCIDENGIIIIKFKATLKQKVQVLDAQSHVTIVAQMCNGIPRPFLNNMIGFNNLPSVSVINFLAKDKGLHELATAKAIVLNSFVMRVIVNQYIKIVQPKYSIKVFKSEFQAVEWLKQFC